MSTLEKAIEIASRAHAGQLDKAGEAYILHPIRVMLACVEYDAKIVAILHDVIEDTSLTIDDLKLEGFGDEILDAVSSLSKSPKDDYQQYLERISQNRLAVLVKLSDLKDNMDLSRLVDVSQKDVERAKKYLDAFYFLKSFL